MFEEPAVEDVIESAWTSIPQHFSGTQIDAFVVMPNHFHGIIALNDRLSLVGAQHAGQVDHRDELSTIVRSFKAAVTRELRIRSLWHSGQFWQSNYYDHIVRNGSDLARIREYIALQSHRQAVRLRESIPAPERRAPAAVAVAGRRE
ncbi:MAG TPA: transposase [Dehalococcoidia bacterium]|nr:transposase [Dehalococcoidia bacterium]